jgi:hypothetical protein
MLVVNLVSWSGLNFNYEPDQIIDLPPETAKARILAGLCDAAPASEKSKAAPAARSAVKRRAPIEGN